jgi:hypothetical protein
MRFLLLSVCGCVVLASGCEWPAAVGSDGKDGLQVPAPTKEMPKAWRLEDIADAAPPRSDDGPTHVLAWKIVEDDRPLRVEYCLVLKELKKPTKDQGRWVLASLARNPAKGKEWNFVTIWITPDPEFKNPPFIMHVEEFKDRPMNAEIYRFMDKYRWTLGADIDWKLIDGGRWWEKSQPGHSSSGGTPNPILHQTDHVIEVHQASASCLREPSAERVVRPAEGARLMEPWMQEEIDALVAEHGTVPPPWVVYDEHPYSICWRMGGGEAHKEVWWEWWAQQGFTEEQKIAYFRRWPPPHCWLAFLIEAVWGVDTFEERDHLTPYFEQTAALGFGNQQEYQRDLADPKWHKR